MEENKFLEILKRHWSKGVLAVLMLGCIFAWGEKLLTSRRAHKGQDYVSVNTLAAQYQRGEPISFELLNQIEGALARQPELHFKCDGMLASIYYAQQDLAKASIYAKAALNLVKDELPTPYQQYSKTSILIAEKEYDVAIRESQKLHEEIKNIKEYETLCGLNLARLLFLADSLKQKALKAQFWAELTLHPSFPTLSSLFQEGSINLKNYFES